MKRYVPITVAVQVPTDYLLRHSRSHGGSIAADPDEAVLASLVGDDTDLWVKLLIRFSCVVETVVDDDMRAFPMMNAIGQSPARPSTPHSGPDSSSI